MTLGPQLLLVVALTLEDAGPSGVDGFFATLARIVAAGLVLSLFLGTLALAASSLTDRKAFASVGFLVFALVTERSRPGSSTTAATACRGPASSA